MKIPRIQINRIPTLNLYWKILTGRLNSEDHQYVTSEFQRQFQSITGLNEVIPISRARFGIYLAISNVIDLKRTEIVICPYTIFDVINMIIAAGAQPSFCDSSQNSLHPTWDEIAKVITSRTAAVLITHYDTTNPDIVTIAAELKRRDIKLIEDCSIALIADTSTGKAGEFGDFSIFSFGLFKTVATPYGGGLFVRSESDRKYFMEQLQPNKRIGSKQLQPYLKRSAFLKFFLNPLIFTLATFPIIWLAYKTNLAWLKSQLDNDPDPIARSEIPSHWFRRPSTTQIQSWTTQLKQAENIIKHQRKIASIYHETLSEHQSLNGFLDTSKTFTKLPNGAFNRATIQTPEDLREKLHNHLILKGYDNSIHFYRNCSTLDIFSAYFRPLPNISNFARRVLVLPNHLSVSQSYARKLATEITTFLSRHNNSAN